MFLNHHTPHKPTPHFKSTVLLLPARAVCGALLLLAILSSCAACKQDDCSLELPVYDATGRRQVFEVVRVVAQGRPAVNLLTTSPGLFRSEGSTLHYSANLTGRVIAVTLANREGVTTEAAEILLTECPQRHSLRVGVSEAGYGDSAGEKITGTIIGCKPDGEWWVRALPMFGSEMPFQVYDGHIKANGEFSITGRMSGERHIVIIGAGASPIKAVAVNVALGARNSMGTIDLGGKCSP